ncbi:MAG: rhombosortase, partial [Burkholderiales bacterium]|nr:rhombosortase [Burkholderiales bacterium]
LKARAWVALAALLAAGALAARWLPAPALDWEPALALTQPWRAWTAAFVHWSGLHLGANLAATAVVGALGVAARLPDRAALAWFAAWPLTQLTLLARPDLLHYGGLSGVLHAGVAVAAAWLLLDARGARRAVAAAIAAGLVAKLVLEQPWGPALRWGGGWDFPVAPWAHLGGAIVGAALGTGAWLTRRRA